MARLFLVALFGLLECGCSRPWIGITVSNTPESIESCGRKIGGC